jgi:hypothetical protein
VVRLTYVPFTTPPLYGWMRIAPSATMTPNETLKPTYDLRIALAFGERFY